MRPVETLVCLVALASVSAGAAEAQAPGGPAAQPPSQPAPASPGPAPTPSDATKDLVNAARLGDDAPKGGVSPSLLRAEVMLDRVHASPGVIDGRAGKNFVDALNVYEKAKGLPLTKGLDEKVWSSLIAASGGPVLMDYKLTDQDVAGPFMPDLPGDYAKLAQLETLAYRDPAQKIGAKFHMAETLLGDLNPGVDLGKAGTTILVASVHPVPIRRKLKSIIVDKHQGEVIGYDERGRILVAYPATIGSRELPSPSGTYKVKGVAWNPVYYYDPKNFVQGDNRGKLKLPPGPNNPVGSVFIALTKPTYGLHGTPDPSKIDKTASHGCVRMTNWDASELAHLVKRGIVVRFKG